MPTYKIQSPDGQTHSISSNSPLSDDEIDKLVDQNAHPVKAFAEGTGLPGILSLAGKGLKAQANLFSDPSQMVDLWKGVGSGIKGELSAIPERVGKFSNLLSNSQDTGTRIARAAQMAGSAVPFIGKSFETGDEAIPTSGEINKGPLAELLGNLTGNVAGLKSPEITSGLSKILKKGAANSYSGLFKAASGSPAEETVKDIAPRLVEEGPYPKTFSRDKASSIFDAAKGEANTNLAQIKANEIAKGTKLDISPAIQRVIKEGGKADAAGVTIDDPLASNAAGASDKLSQVFQRYLEPKLPWNFRPASPTDPVEGALPFSEFDKLKGITGNLADRAGAESAVNLRNSELSPAARAWKSANRGLDEVADKTIGPEYTGANQRISDLIKANDLLKTDQPEFKGVKYVLRRAMYPVVAGAGLYTHHPAITAAALGGMYGLEKLTNSPLFSSLSAQSKINLARMLQSGQSNPELMKALLAGGSQAGREEAIQ